MTTGHSPKSTMTRLQNISAPDAMSTEATVVATLRKVARLIDSETQLDSGTRLIETQLLDSVELLQLVMELETAFSIAIPLEELAPENFTDVAAVTGMVDRICGAET